MTFIPVDYFLLRIALIILNLLTTLEKLELLQEMGHLVFPAMSGQLLRPNSTTPCPSPSIPGGTSISPTPATTPSGWSSAAPFPNWFTSQIRQRTRRASR